MNLTPIPNIRFQLSTIATHKRESKRLQMSAANTNGVESTAIDGRKAAIFSKIKAIADGANLSREELISSLFGRDVQEDAQAQQPLIFHPTINSANGGFELPLVFVEDDRTVYFKGPNGEDTEITIPNVTIKNFPTTFEQELRQEARSYLDEKGKIVYSELERLIRDSISDTEFQPKYIQKAADQANVRLPDIAGDETLGEMYLQHSIYAPISDMFCAFGHKQFRANQNIMCSHVIHVKETRGQHDSSHAVVSCKPDGAVTLADGINVIATMELKAKLDETLAEDINRCILMTTMSILALDSEVLRNCLLEVHIKPKEADIAIPFIIGNHDEASLYVTRITTFSGQCPRVEFITGGYFNDDEPDSFKAELIASVAVLLARISAHCNSISKAMELLLRVRPDTKNLKNVLSVNRTSPGDNKKRSQSPGSLNIDGSSAPDAKRTKPNKNEETAMEMASRNGCVTNLEYPWLRLKTVPCASPWHRDMEFYQQTSLFYFKGVLAKHKCGGRHSSVFCKVWRDGDKHTRRRDIEDEIRFFKKANAHAVPTPKVLEDLTAMDVDFVPEGNVALSTKYHILVTTFEESENVTVQDLLDYSLSLVCAVMKLHSIGVLHCDIKPRNVIWSVASRQALLVDFGHAQDEHGARSYTATEKYQAPEIFLGKPHSRKSDAFGTGRTIEEAIEVMLDKGDIDKTRMKMIEGIREVAKLLCYHVESERLSLEEAETRLQMYASLSSEH